MDAITVDKQVAALRAGDGAVHTALADMNARRAAFTAAKRAGKTDDAEGKPAIRGTSAAQSGPMSPTKQRASGGGSRLFDGHVPNSGAIGQRAAKLLAASAREESKNTGDEDTQLLASLDTETASALRVKRRLCDNSRTVRELLSEYRAERAR
jgi:hypothetical protein